MPGYHYGRAPRNKGLRYPADPPTIDEIIGMMRAGGDRADGHRLRALIVLLWRAGLRISEALALAESDLDASRGAILVRRGKGGKRRQVGMDPWGWEQLLPWLELRDQMQQLAISSLGKAGQIIGAEQPNNEHDFDVSLGQAYALRTLAPKQIRQAAALAFGALAAKFKTDDPRQWRAPRDMFQQTSLGAEQPPPMPFFDRGTFEQFVELH